MGDPGGTEVDADALSTEILVVRHGQSEWNALGLWQGQEDPPLSDLGRCQAREAASSVGSVDAVFASPLQRASETAWIVAEHLGIGPVVELPGLMERHAGEWQGCTRAEIERDWPGYLDAGRRPPSWEDDGLVEQRAMDSLDVIASCCPGGTVLAVAHAGIIYAIERTLEVRFHKVANLSGPRLVHRAGGLTMGERIHLVDHETVPEQL
ncbi:MAG: histidine phosphatase family protein [Microthrixaceae bacterium]|nr:histidine phosphatase family protein [Microthrixaceae bacterium]